MTSKQDLWPFLPALRERRRPAPAEWQGVDKRKPQELKAESDEPVTEPPAARKDKAVVD